MNIPKLISALLIAAAIPAHGAVVHLKDGSRLTGTVISATARDVELHTAQGVHKIDADQIIKIDYSEGAPAPSPEASSPPSQWVRQAPEETSQEMSFEAGVAFPLTRIEPQGTGGSAAKNGDAGARLGVRYLHDIGRRWEAGVDVAFFSRDTGADLSLIPAAETDVYGGSFLAMGMVKLGLTDRGEVRPYLSAGAGVNHTSTVVDARPLLGFAWSDTATDETRRLVSDDAWGPAAAASVGVDFPYMDSAVLSFDLGWTGIFNRKYRASPAGRDLGLTETTGRLDVVSVALRWGWRF